MTTTFRLMMLVAGICALCLGVMARRTDALSAGFFFSLCAALLLAGVFADELI